MMEGGEFSTINIYNNDVNQTLQNIVVPLQIIS